MGEINLSEGGLMKQGEISFSQRGLSCGGWMRVVSLSMGHVHLPLYMSYISISLPAGRYVPL